MSLEGWVYEGVEFNIGDSVKVMRLPTNKEGAMGPGTVWENIWVEGMDGVLQLGHDGVEFEIHDITIEGVEFAPIVDCECEYVEYLYPLSSLEKVQ